MGTEQYGGFYWCVKTTRDVSADGEIYVMADDVQVTQVGALEFIRENKERRVNLALAPGKWIAYFAASMIDGAAVAVEYWANEIINPYQEDVPIKNGQQKERDRMTKSVRYDVMKRDNFKCRLCGANGGESALEIDHIVPVAKGGKTEMENLQTLCKECNRGKRDKQP
jgi:5-methylcytosine-specific restriction endonuclease McrA